MVTCDRELERERESWQTGKHFDESGDVMPDNGDQNCYRSLKDGDPNLCTEILAKTKPGANNGDPNSFRDIGKDEHQDQTMETQPGQES